MDIEQKKKEEDDDWQKIDELQLIREMDELKTMIIKLHEVINIQNDTIERMSSDMENINKTLKRLNNGGDRTSYLKDYLVPLCSVINSMSPVVMMFGVRNILKWI